MRISRSVRANWLYARAVMHHFRYSLLTFLILTILGMTLFRMTPLPDQPRPDLASAFYATLALLGLGEPYDFPNTWYLRLLYLTYPAVGIGVVIQALVRFGFLLVSKNNNEKEWTRVLASTFRNHVILCGLGQVGYRVLERLLQLRQHVVAIEQNKSGCFVNTVKSLGIPVIVADVKEDESLIQAGIKRARAIVIATNDDLANLEVALDARRMNPKIHVVMRMFDQDIARKIGAAFGFQRTFSPPALAAPAIAALALEANVLSSCDIGDRTYVTAEVAVPEGSKLCGAPVGTFHHDHAGWIVALKPRDGEVVHLPPADRLIQAGDVLVVQATIDALRRLNATAHVTAPSSADALGSTRPAASG